MKLLPTLVSSAALLAGLAALPGAGDDPPPTPAPGDTEEERREVPLGFEVSAEILRLRAQAIDPDLEHAQPALDRLAEIALDRVTVEVLMALGRSRHQERMDAAGEALVRIAERAHEDGFDELAGSIGETLYLSSVKSEVRSRAYPLFMLLDSERARRHR